MTEKNELNEKELEKVNGGLRKLDNGGYEFVDGDCFKQGLHAILEVNKYYYDVKDKDYVKCKKYGQQVNGSYYYIMDLDVKVSTLLKGDYLGYKVVNK